MTDLQTAQAIDAAILELVKLVNLSDHALETIYTEIGDHCSTGVAVAYQQLNDVPA